MGQELINRGVAGHGLLWSAGGLLEAPQTVLDIHLDYIEAGADIITTNTYSATRMVLNEAGIQKKFEELNLLACELANEARRQSGKNGSQPGPVTLSRGGQLEAIHVVPTKRPSK